MWISFFFFREQRSCVPSAIPSPHLETWGGFTCDTATQTTSRVASSVLAHQGWICGQLACHRLPPSSSSQLPAPFFLLVYSYHPLTSDSLKNRRCDLWPSSTALYNIHVPAAISAKSEQTLKTRAQALKNKFWDNIYRFCNLLVCFMRGKIAESKHMYIVCVCWDWCVYRMLTSRTVWLYLLYRAFFFD